MLLIHDDQGISYPRLERSALKQDGPADWAPMICSWCPRPPILRFISLASLRSHTSSGNTAEEALAF